MRIRLHRVEAAVDARQRRAASRARCAHGRQVVDIARRAVGAPVAAARSRLRAPPRRGAARGVRRCAMLAPARAEHARVLDAHRAGCGSAARAAAAPARRRLLRRPRRSGSDCSTTARSGARAAAELGQHAGQPMQQRAHAAADQRDRRARRDHLDPADLRQIACAAPPARRSRPGFRSGSSDTVTLVSDEPIRSIDSPCRLKRSNTSARKPTCCHMPIDSIDTSVMPLRELIALTLGAVAAPSRRSRCRRGRGGSVSLIASGTRGFAQRTDQRGCSTFAPVVAISCASS